MADFDLEQLKTLFENLADRLEQTEGDTDTVAELQKMRAMMSTMAKTIGNSAKPGGHRRENKEWMDQFWQTWKQQNPFGTLKNTAPARDPQGTILQQILREQRNKGKSGLSADDSKVYLNRFHKNVDDVSSNMKNFGSSVKKTSDGISKFFDNLKAGGLLTALGGGSGSFLGRVEGAAVSMVDSYRKLKQAGDGSVGSIQEMNTAANSAYMSASELAAAFEKASDSTKKLGALRFVQLQTALISATRGANELQMSFDDYKKATDDYTSILASRGQLFDQNNSQIVDGIKRMVKASEQTASILGVTREEAIKARADANQDVAANDLARRRGLNQDTFANAKTQIKAIFGDAGNELFNSLTNHSAFTQAGSQLASTNPEAYKAILEAANKVSQTRDGDGSDKNIQTQLAASLKAYGQRAYNDPRGEFYDQIAENKGGKYADVAYANVQSGLAAKNLNTVQPKNPAGDQGTNLAQDTRDQMQIIANEANRAVTAFFNPILNDPKLMQNLYDDAKAFGEGLHTVVEWMVQHPKTVEGLGVAVLAATGLFAALNLAVGAMLVTLGPFKTGGLLFKGIRSLAGGAATRAAGVASGGSLSGLGAAAATGATVLGGLAIGVGGSYLAGRQIDKRKGESFFGTGKNEQGFIGSRSTSYGAAALSGAAGGALIGSVVPVIGTAVGAAVGGALGLGYAGLKDYLGHDGKTAANPAARPSAPKNAVDMHKRLQAINPTVANTVNRTNQTPTPPAVNDNRLNKPLPVVNQVQPAKPVDHANASPGRKIMSMDDMTQKIMESSDRAANHLKAIKDNSDQQLTLMREDLTLSRAHSERVQRLLEESNRNTKRSADRTS